MTYHEIQKGMKAYLNINISSDRMVRLDESGFQFQTTDYNVLVFEKHCCNLLASIDEFGHRNVPRRYATNPSAASEQDTQIKKE